MYDTACPTSPHSIISTQLVNVSNFYQLHSLWTKLNYSSLLSLFITIMFVCLIQDIYHPWKEYFVHWKINYQLLSHLYIYISSSSLDDITSSLMKQVYHFLRQHASYIYDINISHIWQMLCFTCIQYCINCDMGGGGCQVESRCSYGQS